jgi:arsenite-transporting ATPase
MSEIEVEAVDGDELADDASRLPRGVDAPDYVLYGGKGGVGKTTMAAATGLASAADGTPTLVVSTDPAHSLSDTLEVEIPAEPSRVREDVPLYAAEIDPDAAMQDGLFGPEGPMGGAGPDADGDAADLGPMGDLLGGDGANPLLGGQMPGADEAAAMQQLLRYLDDERFERVVVDTAPTGHTLRLLQLPEMLDSMVGRFVKLREQFGGMMDSLKGMFGGDAGAGGPDLDELAARIERLRAVLRDPTRTDFRVVMVPEEMSVVESERLVSRLDEFDIPVNTLVVNRVMEDLTEVAPVTAVDGETPGDETGSEASEPPTEGPAVDPSWVVTPNLETCEFCNRRWEVQQNALQRATELFRGRDVKRVPLLADEVRGEAALRVVAACLD